MNGDFRVYRNTIDGTGDGLVFHDGEGAQIRVCVFYCFVCGESSNRSHDECIARFHAECAWWAAYSFVMRERVRG